jgi:TetR/AcrR family transcriptional regulator, cholesterol catabolism regulator
MAMPRKVAPSKAAEDDGDGTAVKARRRDAEVLAVAAQIFTERGYASATVQDVADALGMLKGSLYYYIDSKEDLLYRLLCEIHDGVDEVLAEVTAVEGLSAMEQIELYVKRQVEYNARNLKRISIYYHDADQLSPTRRTEILTRRKAHEEHVINLIRQAQTDGAVDPDLDARLLSNCVFATVIWIYRWYRPGRRLSVEELSQTCALFVRNGLGGGKPPRSPRKKSG